MSDIVLEVERLEVSLADGSPVVEDVSFRLGKGGALGVVGESGSGKTTTSLALLGYTRPGTRITSGSIRVGGHELVGTSEAELRRLRGRLVSYVPQEPAVSLSPASRIGAQLANVARAHQIRDAADAVRQALERAQLPSSASFQRRYPHELSGGQQQRVGIAMALVGGPSVVVLDEPTTGLDVVTQDAVLTEISRLRLETGIAMVYVSHNLAAVAMVVESVAVMYAGRLVESGPVKTVLTKPRHPYTRGLVASVPDVRRQAAPVGIPGIALGVGNRPVGCSFAPRCAQRVAVCLEEFPPVETHGKRTVRCFQWERTPPLDDLQTSSSRMPESVEAVPLLRVSTLRAEHRSRRETVRAAEDVTFSVGRGETVALVGESGSGKTTIARCIAGLHRPAGGSIELDGEMLAPNASQRTRDQRRRVQIVFQNPYESLNPRHRIKSTILRPARILRGLGEREATNDMQELLERVRLPRNIYSRYPGELSGGERQRVAIARALIAKPELLVCDEITSSLDVSVQAAVLDLLRELGRELELAILMITHDLGVVGAVADRMLVLESGVVREEGSVGAVLRSPVDPYTRRLIESAPSLADVEAA